jgi:hypothetical protein
LDVSKLEVGEHLELKDIEFPPGVKIAQEDKSAVVAHVRLLAVKGEEAAAEEEEEPTKEPEVIAKKTKEEGEEEEEEGEEKS